MTLSEYIDLPQFSVNADEKENFLFQECRTLHEYHYSHSKEYARICDVIFPDSFEAKSLAELPFIPVSAFKNFDLKSIPEDKVYKVLTSSGTTGSSPSKIYLDTETATLQTKSLSKIIGHIVGTSRLPMMIIDSKDVLKNRESFSARGAGILGLSPFGKDHTYILDGNYEIDNELFNSFVDKYNGQPILIFGFTFMVWQYLNKLSTTREIDFSNAILIHSGGWKKLSDMAVDNQVFKNYLKDKFGISRVYNFYGMVEQVGSVFLENSKGYLHCPNFADIIIRNPVDFSVQPFGEPGLIQTINLLPKSYPGYSLLTEDIGVCVGEDDEATGWKGKYFKILGRAKKAELRGCSDTFASKMSSVL